MATTSRRVLWKGAISFGLVHIPIALHSATEDKGLDFDWLDKRSMDPVGYKRINKKTGKEIESENIVKGIEYEDGQYVILSADEIAAAYPKTTQTIEIETFVPAASIPFVYFERPYYISPTNKADKVYALLREVLKKTDKVGVAKVVIQTKQHLALLVPSGPALVLNLLRWGDEVRSFDELNLPPQGTAGVGLSAKELQMGEQLVEDMSSSWKPEDFTDVFREQIMKLVDAKVKAGDTEQVAALETAAPAETGNNVYDLTELLKRSLDKGGKAAGNADSKATGKAAQKASAKPAGQPASNDPVARPKRAAASKTAPATSRSATATKAAPAAAKPARKASSTRKSA
jgi:DNA end-binding protein Ku